MWDWTYAIHIPRQLLPGLETTLEASIWAGLIAVVLGLLWAIIRYLRVPVLSHLVVVVLEFVRDTPLLLQLYFIFYVLPTVGLIFDPLLTGILAMGLFFSSYTSEAYRGALLTIPNGQWEAAKVIGLSPTRTWASIVLPQALRLALPPVGTYIIWLFKESALLSTITVTDLMQSGLNIGAQTYQYLEPITIVGLIYIIISYPISRLIRRLEARYEYIT